MNTTYLTTEELAERIKYNPRTIREYLKDNDQVAFIKPEIPLKRAGEGRKFEFVDLNGSKSAVSSRRPSIQQISAIRSSDREAATMFPPNVGV